MNMESGGNDDKVSGEPLETCPCLQILQIWSFGALLKFWMLPFLVMQATLATTTNSEEASRAFVISLEASAASVVH